MIVMLTDAPSMTKDWSMRTRGFPPTHPRTRQVLEYSLVKVWRSFDNLTTNQTGVYVYVNLFDCSNVVFVYNVLNIFSIQCGINYHYHKLVPHFSFQRIILKYNIFCNFD